MGSKASRVQRARAAKHARQVAAEQRKFEAGIETAIAAGEQAQAAGLDPDVMPPAPPLDPRPTPTGPTSAAVLGSSSTTGSGKRIPGQQLTCGWCGQPILVKGTGRLPKWCSEGCRHRAWEQSRAATSGQAAVKVVDRYIYAIPNTTDGWASQLTELATQIRYQHHLDADMLSAAVDVLRDELEARTRWHDTEHRY